MLNFTKPQKFKAKIVTKNQLTKTVYFIQYELIEPTELTFIAGQTMMLTVAPSTHRSMSIASPPQQKHILDSIQDVSPMGIGSKWLLERKIGDIVDLTAPLGRFVINKDNNFKKILVATGSGIAPYRSMLNDETEQSIKNLQVSYFWGLRYPEDIYLTDEIDKIKSERPNFSFYLTLSKPGDSWSGLRGYIQEHLFNTEKDLKNCDFYLCGNKNMIMDVEKKLLETGITRSQVKFDPYY